MIVDGFGLPVLFDITAGQVNDSTAAPEVIDALPKSEYVVADKGYDSEALRHQIRQKKSVPVIPRRSNSKIGDEDIDWCLYKYRRLVEKCVCSIEAFSSDCHPI